MSDERIPESEIPTYSSTEEQNEIWRAAKSDGEPAIAVGPVDDSGYVAKYDFHHLSIQLTEEAGNEVAEILREHRDQLLKEPEYADIDGIGVGSGQSSGRIFPIKEEDAIYVASRISEIVMDSDNWEEYPGGF